MEFVIRSLLEEFGVVEWLIFWIGVIIVPVSMVVAGVNELRSGEKRNGTTILGIGLVLVMAIVLLLIRYGRWLFELTARALGGWAIGLLVAGVICLVALPMGLVGAQLRLAFEYGRRGYWSQGGTKALVIGLIGLSLIIGATFVIINRNLAIGVIFAVLVSIPLALGWFGRFLVPEVLDLPEDREPLEAPEVRTRK